jgi:Ubiquitin-conjugating enzyme
LTKIYHPNVDISTGAICVNTLKRDWTSTTTLSHIVNVIRCLLIVPFPESSLNDEAGKLFMESYTEYYKRAKLMADVHGRTMSYYTQLPPNNSIENNNKSTAPTDPSTFKKSSSEVNNSTSSSSNTPLRSNNQNTPSATGLHQSNNCNPSKTFTKSSSSLSSTTNSTTNKKGMVNKQKSKSLKRL